MTKVYTPRLRYLSRERVDKIAKDILGQCTEDRKLALEGYKYFKQRVDQPEGGEVSNADKALMLECLKIAQAAKRDSVKIVEVFAKASEQVASANPADKSQNVSFNDLDEMTADD